MDYLLLSPAGTVLTGRTLFEAVFDSRNLQPDWANRRLIFRGEPDTVTFSPEYTDSELSREFAERGLTLLRRMGYGLYRPA